MTSVIASGSATWAPQPNTFTLHLGIDNKVVPTSTHAFLFQDGRVLAVEVLARGWDVPGGHRERGESALDSILREVSEEAGATLLPEDIEVAGWCHLMVHAPMPEGYKYPYPSTHQFYYLGSVVGDNLATTVPQEIGALKFMDLAEAREAFAERHWLPMLEALWPTA